MHKLTLAQRAHNISQRRFNLWWNGPHKCHPSLYDIEFGFYAGYKARQRDERKKLEKGWDEDNNLHLLPFALRKKIYRHINSINRCAKLKKDCKHHRLGSL